MDYVGAFENNSSQSACKIRQTASLTSVRETSAQAVSRSVKSEGLTVLVGRSAKNEKNGDGPTGSQQAWLGVLGHGIWCFSLKQVSVTPDAPSYSCLSWDKPLSLCTI